MLTQFLNLYSYHFTKTKLKSSNRMLKISMSLTPLSCRKPPIEYFFDDDFIFLEELFKDDLVIHTTTLKHVDRNVEDVCVDDESMFLEELFKDECDHSSEKTCFKELKPRVLAKRTLAIILMTTKHM